MDFSFASLRVHTEADVVFRASRLELSPVPRFTIVRMLVDLARDESEQRVCQLHELVEERCPATSLFVDAGIVPDLEWRVRPTGERAIERAVSR